MENKEREFYTTTRFISNTNVRRCWGPALGWNRDTQTTCEGEGLIVGDQIHMANLATEVYAVSADRTHTNDLIGVALKEFHRIGS